MENCIISTSIGYNYKHIEVFINSIDFKCDLILFTDKHFRLNGHKSLNVIQINVKKIKLPVKYNLNTPNNIRLLWYMYYLKSNPNYKNIMLSDIRDVFFQSNPFDLITDDKMIVAEENIDIRRNDINRNWLFKLYGEEYANSKTDKPVYCSGTILGCYTTIMEY